MPFNIVGRRNLRLVLEHQAEAQPDKTFLVYEHSAERAHPYPESTDGQGWTA